jgi:hypothetical protein
MHLRLPRPGREPGRGLFVGRLYGSSNPLPLKYRSQLDRPFQPGLGERAEPNDRPLARVDVGDVLLASSV